MFAAEEVSVGAVDSTDSKWGCLQLSGCGISLNWFSSDSFLKQKDQVLDSFTAGFIFAIVWQAFHLIVKCFLRSSAVGLDN